MNQNMKSLISLATFFFLSGIASGFVQEPIYSRHYHSSKTKRIPTTKNTPTSFQLFQLSVKSDILTESSALILAKVPVFDGSSIHDPVVVSSLYWSNLWHGISTWLLTQFFVGIFASIVLVFSTSQLIALGEYISLQTNRVFLKEKNPLISKDSSLKLWSPITTNNTPDRVVKLALCIVIDLLGSVSELIPFLGEVFDVLWAPIAAYTLRSLYADSNIIFVLEFMEEILPFTDFIPLATLCWIIETYYDDSEIAKALKIGKYARK